jgi:uncharacterized cupredoxin-like copper-binding protein
MANRRAHPHPGWRASGRGSNDSGGPRHPGAMAGEEYVANVANSSAADWEAMQEVTVELGEFSFTPNELTFETGVPYELKLRNVGQEKHYFTAHEFYRSVATRKAETAQSD